MKMSIAMKFYHKIFRLRLSMKDGIELQAHENSCLTRAAAVLPYAVAASVLLWVIRWW